MVVLSHTHNIYMTYVCGFNFAEEEWMFDAFISVNDQDILLF